MTPETNPLHQLGDGPVEDRYAEQMRSLARGLDAVFNGPKTGDEREVGFVLLVMPLGDREGRCNYISNGLDRRAVADLLRDQAARFEAQVKELEQ